jgi:hypothetical protein
MAPPVAGAARKSYAFVGLGEHVVDCTMLITALG